MSEPRSTRPDTPTPPSGSRRLRRVALTCLVWIEGRDQPQGTEGIARALDLTPEGVGLLSPRPLALGVPLNVELLVPPTNLVLRATGEVVHCGEQAEAYRIGIRFHAPPTLSHSAADAERADANGI